MRTPTTATFFMLSISLASCVSAPRFMTDALTPNDIVMNLRCQLAEAVLSEPDPHEWIKAFQASFIITLRVIKSNDSGGDASLSIPLTPGIATPRIALGIDTSASRTIDFKVNDKIADLIKSAPCNKGRLLLEGDLGIRSYLDRIRPVTEGLPSTSDLYNSNYTLEFTIDKGLTASSRFSMIPVNINTFGANVSVGFFAQYTHTLKLTIAPPPKKKPPTEVIIVNDHTTNITTLLKKFERYSEQIANLESKVSEKEAARLRLSEEQPSEKAKRLKEIKGLKSKIEQLNNLTAGISRSINATKTRDQQRETLPSTDQRLRDGQTRSLLDDIRRDTLSTRR